MKSRYQLFRAVLLIVSVLLISFIVPLFGNGSYVTYMIPVFAVMLIVFVKSNVKGGAFFIIPGIITAAFIYVVFCETCTSLKKSTIFTLWLCYLVSITLNYYNGKVVEKSDG
ncbi:MAG: hypothetical protein NE328_08230 [Lentisphaeraceae bacterium]|nr:hypothetical protein [Lentisphaeraceae bacterium]